MTTENLGASMQQNAIVTKNWHTLFFIGYGAMLLTERRQCSKGPSPPFTQPERRRHTMGKQDEKCLQITE